MAWTKQVFNKSLITSEFLNDFQDAVIADEQDIAALDLKNKLLLYNEEASGGYTVPYTLNQVVSNMPRSCVLPSVVPERDDIVLGITTGNIGIITTVSTNKISVKGLGLRLLTQ